MEQVPGTVVAHAPAREGRFLGSPTIVAAADALLVAHDVFGERSDYRETHVYRSEDDGTTWLRIASIEGQFWSTLFVHDGALFLLGAEQRFGDIVIRRSDDGGHRWTEPADEASGRLLHGRFHTAPTPVVHHGGRVWRAIEDLDPEAEFVWGRSFRAGMMSAPGDADLLRADSWTVTRFAASDPAWLGGQMNGWLEGNAVPGPDGRMLDLLRVDVPTPDPALAAIMVVDSEDLSFEPAHGFVEMPGGISKFTVRWDAARERYWAVVNHVPDVDAAPHGFRSRNYLYVVSSPDLRTWDVGPVVASYPDDDETHAFQYADWVIEGEDMLIVSRTAFDDNDGGAESFHNTNFITFHRVTLPRL